MLKLNKTNSVKFSPFFSNIRTLGCKQVIDTTSLTTSFTISIAKVSGLSIYQNATFYIQFVGKRAGNFNIHLENHRKDEKDASAIEVDNDFTLPDHNFNTNTKFIPIEQLKCRANAPTETIKERLKNRIFFWITKLKVLTPNGINQELK